MTTSATPYLRRLITPGCTDFGPDDLPFLQHEYDRWIGTNLRVYHDVVAEVRKEGMSHDTVARAWEEMRRSGGRTFGGDQAYPNEHRAYLARHVMFLEGDLDGVFTTRPCAADEWLQERIGKREGPG